MKLGTMILHFPFPSVASMILKVIVYKTHEESKHSHEICITYQVTMSSRGLLVTGQTENKWTPVDSFGNRRIIVSDPRTITYTPSHYNRVKLIKHDNPNGLITSLDDAWLRKTKEQTRIDKDAEGNNYV